MSKKNWTLVVTLFLLLGVVSTAAASRAQSLVNRHRIGLRMGHWDSELPHEARQTCSGTVETNVKDLLSAVYYSHRIEPSLAVHLTLKGLLARARSSTGVWGDCSRAVVITSVLFGLRHYPLSFVDSSLQPFLEAGAGPYFGVESWKQDVWCCDSTTRTESTFGGYIGGGLDVQMGRHLVADFNVGYNLMADFPNRIAGEDNYSGVEIGVGISVLLGQGRR